MVRKKILKHRALAFAFSMLIACVLIASPAFSQDGPLKVGDVIGDDLMVTTMDGKQISLKKGLEKDYNLIQFMTTACSACRSELTTLLEYQESVKDKLAIYPIAGDMSGAPAVERYKKKMILEMTFYLDSEFSLPPVFGFTFTPSIAILDKQGKILYTKGGYMPSDKAELIGELNTIIK